MNKEYFGYIRVSTVKQGEGVSLEAQREAIERYCAQQGLNITKWYEEKETAAKQGRPLFTDMIKQLHHGKAQGVVMHKIDRSARNLRDWATVGELSDTGVDVHFAAESVDFASRGGRLTADIQAVIAADYIRNLREEVKKGQLGRLKQGLYPFYAPFGYLNQGSHLPKAVDPIRGPLVRKMFELYATGEYSLQALEDEMHHKGLRSVAGRKVYKSKIDNILNNPFYMGVIKLKAIDTPFNGIHEPLVSPELFQRVQEARKHKARKKKTKHNFRFRGVFNCAGCLNQYSPEYQRGHVYYRCHTKGCSGGCVREDVLNTKITDHLQSLQIDESAQAQINNSLNQRLSELPKDTTGVANNLQLAQIDAQLERLTQGYIDGLISEDVFRTKKADCDLRKVALSKTQRKALSYEEKAQQVRRFFEHLKNLCQTYLWANDSEKRQFINTVFSNISLSGKTLELEPNSWLRSNPKGGFVRLCGDNEDSLRSRFELGISEFENILDVFTCPEIITFCELCDQIQQRCSNVLP